MPKDAEDVLLEHPAVAQALVVPVPGPKMGETGVAFIVCRPGVDGDPDELTSLVATRLARFRSQFLLAERAAAELGLARPDA